MFDISSTGRWCLALRGDNVMQNPMKEGMDVEKLGPSAISVLLHLKDNRNVIPNVGNGKSVMKIHFGNSR